MSFCKIFVNFFNWHLCEFFVFEQKPFYLSNFFEHSSVKTDAKTAENVWLNEYLFIYLFDILRDPFRVIAHKFFFSWWFFLFWPVRECFGFEIKIQALLGNYWEFLWNYWEFIWNYWEFEFAFIFWNFFLKFEFAFIFEWMRFAKWTVCVFWLRCGQK